MNGSKAKVGYEIAPLEAAIQTSGISAPLKHAAIKKGRNPTNQIGAAGIDCKVLPRFI